jgi:VIT1/CCC1 family predicted Fe2+/Mn2+ transporter
MAMASHAATLLPDAKITARTVPSQTIRAGPAAFVRDVILGGQDGLVNVLGLVLGMAVATGDSRVVVTAGLAALLAESIAMAGVAYTSSGAERQLAAATRTNLRLERESLALTRAVERSLRFRSAGLSPEARALAESEAELEARAWLARLEEERAALSPVREARPIRTAAIVGVSTAIGSAVPLLPFVLLPMSIAPIVALAAGGAVLAVAGIERAVLTGGSRLRAAIEMLAIGLVSAFAGYLIGQILRVPGA